MPAPRLLEKKAIAVDLADQRKQQIDAGVALAKKVDAIRGTLQEEEERIERFRRETLQRTQQEIDAKIAEREELRIEVAVLQEERIKLLAPIDLSQAWEEVRTAKIENAIWEERLQNQTIELLAQGDDAKNLSAKLASKEGELLQKDDLAERTLIAAEEKFAQADTLHRLAFEERDKSNRECQQQENHLKIREEDAVAREANLSIREEAASLHEINLSDREKKLRSRQELFLKAQAYIKSKK